MSTIIELADFITSAIIGLCSIWLNGTGNKATPKEITSQTIGTW